MLRFVLTILMFNVLAQPGVAEQHNQARQTPISLCQAVAQKSGILRAGYSHPVQVNLGVGDVKITYVAHSTFRLEDATGIKIATDYSGEAGQGGIPDVVTMNHAHITHWTPAPDPRIPHVLKGWGEDGKPAHHHVQIGETIIRNVTTDIQSNWVGFEENGNSIFIFEMGGLCIGHLGHLHHLLTDEHYAKIGRLDILMVPVDGGHTMNLADMTKVVERLNASIILPMHWFGSYTLNEFLSGIKDGFPIEVRAAHSMTVSLNTLPPTATVVVLQPETFFDVFAD